MHEHGSAARPRTVTPHLAAGPFGEFDAARERHNRRGLGRTAFRHRGIFRSRFEDSFGAWSDSVGVGHGGCAGRTGDVGVGCSVGRQRHPERRERQGHLGWRPARHGMVGGRQRQARGQAERRGRRGRGTPGQRFGDGPRSGSGQRVRRGFGFSGQPLRERRLRELRERQLRERRLGGPQWIWGRSRVRSWSRFRFRGLVDIRLLRHQAALPRSSPLLARRRRRGEPPASTGLGTLPGHPAGIRDRPAPHEPRTTRHGPAPAASSTHGGDGGRRTTPGNQAGDDHTPPPGPVDSLRHPARPTAPLCPTTRCARGSARGTRPTAPGPHPPGDASQSYCSAPSCG